MTAEARSECVRFLERRIAETRRDLNAFMSDGLRLWEKSPNGRNVDPHEQAIASHEKFIAALQRIRTLIDAR